METRNNAELAVLAIRYQGERDFASLHAMSADDAVLDFPYHPKGPRVYHGRDEMIRKFRVIEIFDTFRFDVVQVFETDGEEVIAEARSCGTYADGRAPYKNHYIFVLQFADGKLTRWREFFNPLEAMKHGYAQPCPPGPTVRDGMEA